MQGGNRMTTVARRRLEAAMSRWIIIFLVLAILVIVYSPFVDLPYTTVRSKATLDLFCLVISLTSALLAQAVVAPGRSANKYRRASDTFCTLPPQDMVRITCAFLC